jgi:L-ascorbate metabolism protein UlaG (beta-lactamase superfamily)
VLPEFLFGRKQRFPKVTPGPFRTDASVYGTAPASGLRVTWFGHSSMLVEIDGVTVLIDPVWEERAAPVQWLGPRRFFPPTLRLEELPPLDAILISHDHYDHLGKGTMQALASLQPRSCWVAPMGVAAELRAFGVPAGRIEELNWLDRARITARDGSHLTVTAVPSRHFSGRSLFNRNETLWTSYALRAASHNVYYGADSGLWGGFGAIGERFGPFDLTMLEIGAFHEAWKDIHLGPDGAVQAFEASGGKLMMPIHWGLFDLALHGWREPIGRVWQVAGERGIPLFSPEPGRPTEVGEVRSDWWQRD